jgi:hypothetical protein
VIWPESLLENISPFARGGRERPLRLTIHQSDEAELLIEDREALDLIYELSSEDELDVLDFVESSAPKIEFKPENSDQSHLNLRVVDNNSREIFHHIGVLKSNIDDRSIQLRFGLHDPDSPSYKCAQKDLKSFKAHIALSRDIFVTNSSYILDTRENPERGNPRTPTETTKIAGLCLRTRGNWTYINTPNANVSTDLGMAYWKVTRAHLPNMWCYFSILLHAIKDPNEFLRRTAQGILERSSRAFQARDEIGKQFYLPQDNNTRDLMMYHFEYLTLLLAGVYDAFATIVNRIHEIVDNDYLVGFRKSGFRSALDESGANALYEFIGSKEIRDKETMLHDLRNTIHSAAIGTLAYVDPGNPQESYAKLPPELGGKIWSAAQRISSTEGWGLYMDSYVTVDDDTDEKHHHSDVWFEPYTYASTLISTWLPVFDSIARLTDLSEFPYKNSEPILKSLPSDWEEDVRRFLLLIG